MTHQLCSMESHRFDAGIYWQVLGSWPEDELQMSLIVLVTGLVTLAGSVGYLLIRCWSVLRFLSPAENSWKVLQPTMKIQRGLSQLQLHRVSNYSWLFPPQLFWNHSETSFKHPHPPLDLALFQSPICWEAVYSRSSWSESWYENGDLQSRWRTRCV